MTFIITSVFYMKEDWAQWLFSHNTHRCQFTTGMLYYIKTLWQIFLLFKWNWSWVVNKIKVPKYIRGHLNMSKYTFPAVPNTYTIHCVHCEPFNPSLTTKKGTLFPSVIYLLTCSHIRTKWKNSKPVLWWSLLLVLKPTLEKH